jgi:hypothetical protein
LKCESSDAVIGVRLAHTREMLARWENEGQQPADRIRRFNHILIANQADIKRYNCPVGTPCTELAKLNHAARPEANRLLALFRTWLRRQFTLLGRKPDADALAMHLLARGQGAATLANAFHDETFLSRDVERMCDWLKSCAKSAGPAEPPAHPGTVNSIRTGRGRGRRHDFRIPALDLLSRRGGARHQWLDHRNQIGPRFQRRANPSGKLARPLGEANPETSPAPSTTQTLVSSFEVSNPTYSVMVTLPVYPLGAFLYDPVLSAREDGRRTCAMYSRLWEPLEQIRIEWNHF